MTTPFEVGTLVKCVKGCGRNLEKNTIYEVTKPGIYSFHSYPGTLHECGIHGEKYIWVKEEGTDNRPTGGWDVSRFEAYPNYNKRGYYHIYNDEMNKVLFCTGTTDFDGDIIYLDSGFEAVYPDLKDPYAKITPVPEGVERPFRWVPDQDDNYYHWVVVDEDDESDNDSVWHGGSIFYGTGAQAQNKYPGWTCTKVDIVVIPD